MTCRAAASTPLCPSCGAPLHGRAHDEGLCAHHHLAADAWAEGNRVMCDFFHRGVAPRRLTPEAREDEFWAHVAEPGDGG